MIIPAGSSRRASQPPFWRIFQLVRAVGPSSPCSTSPENTTKWVFQSKNPASRRASQPPFWRIFQLDRAVGPSSPCSTPSENTTKWVFQSKKEKKKKNAEKKPVGECTRWHVVPPGPGTAHHPRRPGPGGTFV